MSIAIDRLISAQQAGCAKIGPNLDNEMINGLVYSTTKKSFTRMFSVSPVYSFCTSIGTVDSNNKCHKSKECNKGHKVRSR